MVAEFVDGVHMETAAEAQRFYQAGIMAGQNYKNGMLSEASGFVQELANAIVGEVMGLLNDAAAAP
jgi:hypothetical protein